MGIAAFVKSAFESSLTTFDAEEVTIGDATTSGVVEDVGTEIALNIGADDTRRGLRVSFPGEAFETLPTSGQRCTCRSKTWQITRVDNGAGSLVIEMIEPERRSK